MLLRVSPIFHRYLEGTERKKRREAKKGVGFGISKKGDNYFGIYPSAKSPCLSRSLALHKVFLSILLSLLSKWLIHGPWSARNGNDSASVLHLPQCTLLKTSLYTFSSHD